ncbi:MAG TPA: Fe-S cluster assembly ATPase SufC [Candidatus Woesebacteria bacterium]|nr:Fe-S cluster assembly ATPase SufC [Candidatus Woesebacteria bacterium]
MLEIKNLKVSIEKKEILKGVDLEIKQGEVLALMGPNGSGKSSLANVIVGNPKYQTEGEMYWNGKSILKMRTDERARKGILMAFQQPVAIPGVSVREMLLAAMRSAKKSISALELKQIVIAEAKKLKIDESLLTRGINDGFSGGEKKKLEILQMRVLKPSLLILDEIDSGLDVDALKLLAEAVLEMVKKEKMSVLVITHYQKLLKYLIPDRVVVLKKGEVVDSGSKEIVEKIENKGFAIYE